MTNRPESSSRASSSNLTGREEEIAERVRQSLHLSPSMSLDEVADQFRHSAAWRRERLGLVSEEVRDGLWRAIRPLLRSVWGRVRAGWTWLRGDDPIDPSLDGENEPETDE
jgi:hypothetical protein